MNSLGKWLFFQFEQYDLKIWVSWGHVYPSLIAVNRVESWFGFWVWFSWHKGQIQTSQLWGPIFRVCNFRVVTNVEDSTMISFLVIMKERHRLIFLCDFSISMLNYSCIEFIYFLFFFALCCWAKCICYLACSLLRASVFVRIELFNFDSQIMGGCLSFSLLFK